MGLVTLAGFPVLSLEMCQPLQGRWTAVLDVDASDNITGTVDLEDHDQAAGIVYRCTVTRGDVVAGRWRGLIVGGAGGLGTELEAKSYLDVNAQLPVSELVAEAGETLALSSTGSLLGIRLPYWTRLAERASVALNRLCEAIGATWRVLPSGEVWVGLESWPEHPAPLELDRDQALGTVQLAPDSIDLTPGVSLDGVRVGRVEHCLDEVLRTTFWIAP